MDLGIRGKVALVAASSRGLGRAVAEELGREGVRLMLCARSGDALRTSLAEIRSSAGDANVAAEVADLSDPSQLEGVVMKTVEQFGAIDILVTNTGGPAAGPFEAHTAAGWASAVQQNLYSVLNLTRLVLPGMKERGWGRILNITSISVKQPVNNLILSNSIRAAVTGFAKTLANEVASFGVTVNNILPGYTHTQRVDELATTIAAKQGTSKEDAVAAWEQEIPMGRLGTPQEFAALVTFLASDRASYITGTSIPVDGGWTKGLL